ncbi:hypothetical protein K0M31_019109, partial [Melipona bicolor]
MARAARLYLERRESTAWRCWLAPLLSLPLCFLFADGRQGTRTTVTLHGREDGLIIPAVSFEETHPLLASARGPRVILDTFRGNRKMEAISTLPFSYGYVVRSSFQAFRINDSKEELVSL